MNYLIDFEVNHDYFTDDHNHFARILGTNGPMIAGLGFSKINGEFVETNAFVIPAADLSQYIDDYNEKLENFEEEFYEEGDSMEEDLDNADD